jgi:hypothetical protein
MPSLAPLELQENGRDGAVAQAPANAQMLKRLLAA